VARLDVLYSEGV